MYTVNYMDNTMEVDDVTEEHKHNYSDGGDDEQDEDEYTDDDNDDGTEGPGDINGYDPTDYEDEYTDDDDGDEYLLIATSDEEDDDRGAEEFDIYELQHDDEDDSEEKQGSGDNDEDNEEKYTSLPVQRCTIDACEYIDYCPDPEHLEFLKGLQERGLIRKEDSVNYGYIDLFRDRWVCNKRKDINGNLSIYCNCEMEFNKNAAQLSWNGRYMHKIHCSGCNKNLLKGGSVKEPILLCEDSLIRSGPHPDGIFCVCLTCIVDRYMSTWINCNYLDILHFPDNYSLECPQCDI